MKLLNKFNTATLAATAYLATAFPAFAQQVDLCPSNQNFGSLCTDDAQVGNVISQAITLILIIAVVLALAFLIWGGVKWITSGGDKGKVESARNTIIAAIIGLVIAFLAFFILNLVLGLFGIDQFQNMELPNILGNG